MTTTIRAGLASLTVAESSKTHLYFGPDSCPLGICFQPGRPAGLSKRAGLSGAGWPFVCLFVLLMLQEPGRIKAGPLAHSQYRRTAKTTRTAANATGPQALTIKSANAAAVISRPAL